MRGYSDIPKNMGRGAGDTNYYPPKHTSSLNEKLINAPVESGLSIGLSSNKTADTEMSEVVYYNNTANSVTGNTTARPEPYADNSSKIKRRGKPFNLR